MTREEIIKSALKFLVLKQTEQGSWGFSDRNDNEISWNKVLEWLDKQPCGDLISRQEAFDEIIWNSDNGVIDAKVAIEALRKLPSVEPEKCSDCISRKAATDRFDLVQSDDKCMGYDDIMAFLSSLPSVEPERKTGKWRPLEYDGYADGFPVWDVWECDQCGHEHRGESDTLTDYCPDCGAEMEV